MKIKSLGIKLLLAIVCALNTVAFVLFHSIMITISYYVVEKYYHIVMDKHDFYEMMDVSPDYAKCSSCNQSIRKDYTCRYCRKTSGEIFKEEHSCFQNGTGVFTVIQPPRSSLPNWRRSDVGESLGEEVRRN